MYLKTQTNIGRIGEMKIFKMVEKGHSGIDDDGVWFEGNVDHWADCFFSNAEEEHIKAFAEEHGSYILGDIT
jgi:hypothetical protein